MEIIDELIDELIDKAVESILESTEIEDNRMLFKKVRETEEFRKARILVNLRDIIKKFEEIPIGELIERIRYITHDDTVRTGIAKLRSGRSAVVTKITLHKKTLMKLTDSDIDRIRRIATTRGYNVVESVGNEIHLYLIVPLEGGLAKLLEGLKQNIEITGTIHSIEVLLSNNIWIIIRLDIGDILIEKNGRVVEAFTFDELDEDELEEIKELLGGEN